MKDDPDPPIKDDPVKARGRPRSEVPGTSLSAWVPTKEYDRLLKLAQARDQSLSELVRRLLATKR